METKWIKKLKLLLNYKVITLQEYRTYKGQILSGNLEGCIKGLTRKGYVCLKQ